MTIDPHDLIMLQTSGLHDGQAATPLRTGAKLFTRLLCNDQCSPQRWLDAACDQLRRHLGAHVAAHAFIATPCSSPHEAEPAPPWPTEHLGAAGYRPPQLASLQDEAATGWSEDELARRVPRPQAMCATRRELIEDARWKRSQHRARRIELGLHEFVRAIAPFRDPAARHIFVVQADELAARELDDQQALALLASVTPVLQIAFHRRFIRPRLYRRELLEALSPMQQRIAPLLAEGLTETEIATRLERSVHTIHDHTKAIYQTWHVRNRKELYDVWLGRHSLPSAVCFGE